MRAYMVYSRCCGSDEAACLVIANTSREAKNLGWPILRDWGSDEFTDTAVRWLREPNKQARDLIAAGDTVVVECPDTCTQCEKWGEELNKSGVCEQCECDMESY